MGTTESDPAAMNACPNCGEVIDVSACAPYSKVLCPTCNTAIRVRTEFHHFSLQKHIGEGGMSRVFLANDNTLNRPVALKILNEDFSKDAARTAQFEKEARITAAISHPNVVKVFSVGKDQGHFFIAMELVPNGSLDELIRKNKAVPEDRVLEIAGQIVRGLRAAHEAGLIHRDMKPGNLLFAEDDTAKIVDFGLSRVLEKDVDDSHEIWATPYYVPPEQLHRQPEDFRTDIYSLGATLFHALAGKPPYSADTASLEELKAIKEKPVHLKDHAPSVADETCALIDKMMARQPDDRHGTYEELLDHVNHTRKSLSGNGGAFGQHVGSDGGRGRLLAIAAAVIAVVGIVSAFVFSGGDEKTSESGGGNGEAELTEDSGLSHDGTGRTTAQRFVAARDRMFNGNYEDAADVFRKIARDGDTKQPTLNWARFNLGICRLMQGREGVAREVFSRIEADADFSSDEADTELTAFFAEVGGLMSGSLPVIADLRSRFDTATFESLALLAFGLKNWHAGQFEEADAYFTAFQAAEPTGDERWVGRYKGLVSRHAKELDLLKGMPSIKRDATLEEFRAALTEAKRIENGLGSGSRAKAYVSDRVKRLATTHDRLNREAQEEHILEMAQLFDSESEQCDELLASVDPCRDNLAFDEAIRKLEEAKFKHPEVRQLLEDELYVWKAAESFLDTLVADLDAEGYTGTIERRVGSSLQNAAITGASRDEISFQLASGASRIPLLSISNKGLLAIAEPLSRKPEMKEYLKRRELMVLFAYQVGEVETALKAGEELMLDSREFRDLWSRITQRNREE